MLEQPIAAEPGARGKTQPHGDPARRFAVAAFLLVPIGVTLVAIADHVGRQGSAWAAALFWAGLATIFAPAAMLLWQDRLTRAQTLALLLAVALGLYVANTVRNPGIIADYDELLHYRTLDDIVRTGHLFGRNPLLPISPYYPGLEIVTHALMSVTGMGEVLAAMVTAVVARVLLVLSLFLFLERVASPSRLTGLATLLYMTAPSFFAFDAAFAYESLALPLAVFCLFALRAAQAEKGRRRALLNAAGAFAALAVVATHHVTSFILAGTLVGWTVVTLLTRRRPREQLPGGGWVPALTVVAVATWMTGVATATIGYLAPHAVAAGREALRIMGGEGMGRRLFESPGGGVTTPFLERAVGIGSVLLILAFIPLGYLYVRRYQRGDMLVRFLALSTLGYPVVMALRFTKSGWEIGSRAMAFLCIPLAFVLACGVAWVRARRGSRLLPAPLAAAGLTVIFLGGVIAGTSPVNRMARPYAPGSYDASIEGEGLAAAEWARDVLPLGSRIAADSTNGSLMGSYGRQYALSSGGDGVSLSGLFLLPFGDYQRKMIANKDVQYVVVDRRIAGTKPLSGFFFEKWEQGVAPYGSTIDPLTLSRFDDLRDVHRVFDSGGIQVYDVRRYGR